MSLAEGFGLGIWLGDFAGGFEIGCWDWVLGLGVAFGFLGVWVFWCMGVWFFGFSVFWVFG